MWKWLCERFWFVWDQIWFPFRHPVLRWILLAVTLAGIVTGFMTE